MDVQRQGRHFPQAAYRVRDERRPRSADGVRAAWQEELILFTAEMGAARLRGGWGSSLVVRRYIYYAETRKK